MENNDIHLKINMKCMLFAGAFYFYFNNRLQNIVYQTYAWFVRAYFIIFIICQYTELFTMSDKNLFNVVSILAVSLLYTTTIWKLVVCNGKEIRRLVEKLRAIEMKILSYKNKDIEDIYFKYVSKNYACSWFLLMGTITSSLYYIRPIIEEKTIEPKFMNVTSGINNVTVQYRIRSLPLSSWFPFNRYKYYFFCYFYQIIATLIGGTMVVLTGLLFVALMIFIIGQLKILQYNFRNAPKLAKTLKNNIGVSYNVALKHTIRNLIEQHKIIIK